MCFGKPKVAAVEAPPAQQELKQPDQIALGNQKRATRSGGMGQTSLLTGPAGVTNAPTAKVALLGQ